jgi:cell division protein FtsA
MARVGSEGELKVLGTGVVPSEGVVKGRIEDALAVQSTVAVALGESQRYIGKAGIGSVYASVSGTHITSLNTRQVMEAQASPIDISFKILDGLLHGEIPDVGPGQEVLHIIPRGYTVDGLSGARNPVGLHGAQVEVEAHVVLGESAVLRDTSRAIEINRGTLRGLVAQSLASAEAVLTGNEREMGVVLVDIGAGTSDIIIYQQGNPWYSAVVPIGGNQLTRDLSVALHSSMRVAEEIKVKWGSVFQENVPTDEKVVIPARRGERQRMVSRRDLAGPLGDRMAEILKLVMLEVRKSGLRELPGSGIVLTGGAAETEGVSELARKLLRGPARIAYPAGIAGLSAQLRKPTFSAGVGVLLWGIKHQGENDPSRVNRPKKVSKPRRWGLRRKQEEDREVRVS